MRVGEVPEKNMRVQKYSEENAGRQKYQFCPLVFLIEITISLVVSHRI
jgi:hypothetical protein